MKNDFELNLMLWARLGLQGILIIIGGVDNR